MLNIGIPAALYPSVIVPTIDAGSVPAGIEIVSSETEEPYSVYSFCSPFVLRV